MLFRSAGSPETIARLVREQAGGAGVNYFVGQFAFGDLATAEIERSVALFAREVMPAFR